MTLSMTLMTPEELEAYKAETEAIRDRTEAMKLESEMIVRQTAIMAAENDRAVVLQARKMYQSEIHNVAINVLVSILTKDALRAMRDSMASKIDVGEVVEYSLIVGKRYVDELHKISVSEKQIAEHKEQLFMTASFSTPRGVPGI